MHLDVAQVERMADPLSLQRGREYARGGAVGRVRHVADGVRATVTGSDRDAVEPDSGTDGRIGFRCSCPVGAAGAFCKHCVALALVVVAISEWCPARQRISRRPAGV
jgi:uncharacterized Zn finger protein